MSTDMDRVIPKEGWVLFDGSCGFCSWWVPFWAKMLRAHGYEIEMLQSEWVSQRLGLSESEILSDILILRPSGEQVRGADVYRDVMSKVWWLKPIYFCSMAPLSRQIFNLAYKVFNKNRYRVSRVCGMRKLSK